MIENAARQYPGWNNPEKSLLTGSNVFPLPGLISQEELDQSQSAWQTQRSTEVTPEYTLRITSPSVPPNWLSASVEDLNQLLMLEDYWDSYDAQKLDPKSAVFALELLTAVMTNDTPGPSIVPTPPGGIQLEWHRSGIDLEIEIHTEGCYSVFFEDETNQSDSWEGDLPRDDPRTHQIISEFMNQLSERALA